MTAVTYAKIIADSISLDGVRLVTMEVRFHRFVLAEMNTHRVFSRNSASSRAIPVHKVLQRVNDDPANPLSWPAEQKGMQGGEELSVSNRAACQWIWDAVREDTMRRVGDLTKIGLHKSVANRLIEPFSSHTAVITSTAWQNFFAQRCSPLAMPEIRVAAEMMRDAMEASTPRGLTEGQWHTPYVDDGDLADIRPNAEWGYSGGAGGVDGWTKTLAARVSVSRCARVSYLTQDGKRDIKEDLVMYARLTSADPPHWSPMEHVATPWPWNRQEGCIHFGQDPEADHDTFTCTPLDHLPRTGNLLGWRSLRTEVEASQGKRTYS